MFLAGCATPYQKKGWRGGYSDTQVNIDMFEVSFEGNAYTKAPVVYEYLRKRCAEVALENGYTHFVMIDGKDESEVKLGAVNGQLTTINKVSNRVVIKLLKEPSPDIIAYDAAMVLGKRARSDKLPSWND